MDHKTTLTQHVNASPDKVWAVISDIPGSAATLSGIDSIQMLSDGGTDLSLTFGAEVVRPTLLSRIAMALFGKIGMSMTRKALAKDLAEIAAKAESL